MKKVALLHTVPSVFGTFPDRVRAIVPGAVVYNTLDDYLISDPAERGAFTTEHKNRLFAFLQQAEASGADAICVTCSSLTPYIELVRPFLNVPVVTADGAMLKKALSMGNSIAVAHTSDTAGPAVEQTIRLLAAPSGKQPSVTCYQSKGAFDAIRKLDAKKHDALVLEMVKSIANADVIVLAQASMAHLEQQVASITGIPTLSAPDLCLEELRQVLA